MSIQTIKKEILELKRAAAIKYKQSEDYRIQNMTDEELREAINQDLKELGFDTYAEYREAVNNFVFEKDPQTNMTNDFAIDNRFSELTEDFKIFEEFLQKYSSSLVWS